MKDDTSDEDPNIGDGGTLFAKEWWNIHGGATPQMQNLATWVLSQLANTSSIKRCLETSLIYCFGPFGLHISVCRWPIL